LQSSLLIKNSFWQICQFCVIVRGVRMVVIRPDILQIVDIDIEFNYVKYSKLEIDLQHINRGKKLTRHSNFLLEEVLILVTFILDGEVIGLNASKSCGDENCDYFSILKRFQGNNYKLVLCVCSDRKDTLGIITLYRARK
jgi:hypothetical protein